MSISSDPKHHYIYSKTLRPCDQLVNAPQSAGLFLLIDLSFNLTYYHEKFIFNTREGFALRHFLPGSAVNRGGGGMRGQALIARHGGKI